MTGTISSMSRPGLPLFSNFLLYREVTLRVPSALMSLTSVFGIHKYALIWHIYAENLAR